MSSDSVRSGHETTLEKVSRDARAAAGSAGGRIRRRRRVKPLGQRVRNRVRRLLNWDDLPDYLKDNEYISTGYRVNYNVRETWKSLFAVHNEAGNIWSHFLGFLFFVGLTVCVARLPPTPLALGAHNLDALWHNVSDHLHQIRDDVQPYLHYLEGGVHNWQGSLHALGESLQHKVESSGDLLHTRLAQLGQQVRELHQAAAPQALPEVVRMRISALAEAVQRHLDLHPTARSLQQRLQALQVSLRSLKLPAAAQVSVPRLREGVRTIQSGLNRTWHEHLAYLAASLHSLRGHLAHGVHTVQGGVQNRMHSVHDGLRSGMQQLQARMAAVSDSMAEVQQGLAGSAQALHDSVGASAALAQGAFGDGLAAMRLHVRQYVDGRVQAAVAPSLTWPLPRWPVYVYMAGAMTCLLSSAVCHLFGCCAEHIASVIWRADYAGISLLIMTSFIPVVYYGFLCSPGWMLFYLVTTGSLGSAVICVSLLDRFQAIEWRTVRAVLFTALGLWGIIPSLHNIALNGEAPQMKLWLVQDLCMGVAYVSGAVIYACRVPERWWPGKFDILFHSHQIFHLAVVLGAYLHYQAVLVILQWREASGGCAVPVLDGHVDDVLEQMRADGSLIGADEVVQYLQQRMLNSSFDTVGAVGQLSEAIGTHDPSEL